jgi:hypothetical protein
MGQLARLRIWDDPAIRDRLASVSTAELFRVHDHISRSGGRHSPKVYVPHKFQVGEQIGLIPLASQPFAATGQYEVSA